MPEKMTGDRGALDALLASTVLGHVAFVDADGGPAVVPTAVVRWGDLLLTHGSTGSRWLRRIGQGVPVAVSVATVDGLVVARSAFESSVVYRSAVLFGSFAPVPEEQRAEALDALTERFLPGRTAEVRASTRKELAATSVLAMPITDWSLRVSDGWPEDGEDDVAGSAWAGQVRFGAPATTVRPAPDLRPGIAVPASVSSVTGIR
jgi:nitroimidazol reductase NimA-like FMN-containing flavoprotein (pyridoxamine 5'-phosphate oxidase superfamily)